MKNINESFSLKMYRYVILLTGQVKNIGILAELIVI